MKDAESDNRKFTVGQKFRTTDHRLAWSWPGQFIIAEELEADHLAPDVPKVRLDPTEPTDANLIRGEDDIEHALEFNVIETIGGDS